MSECFGVVVKNDVAVAVDPVCYTVHTFAIVQSEIRGQLLRIIDGVRVGCSGWFVRVNLFGLAAFVLHPAFVATILRPCV